MVSSEQPGTVLLTCIPSEWHRMDTFGVCPPLANGASVFTSMQWVWPVKMRGGEGALSERPSQERPPRRAPLPLPLSWWVLSLAARARRDQEAIPSLLQSIPHAAAGVNFPEGTLYLGDLQHRVASYIPSIKSSVWSVRPCRSGSPSQVMLTACPRHSPGSLSLCSFEHQSHCTHCPGTGVSCTSSPTLLAPLPRCLLHSLRV